MNPRPREFHLWAWYSLNEWLFCIRNTSAAITYCRPLRSLPRNPFRAWWSVACSAWKRSSLPLTLYITLIWRELSVEYHYQPFLLEDIWTAQRRFFFLPEDSEDPLKCEEKRGAEAVVTKGRIDRLIASCMFSCWMCICNIYKLEQWI